MKKYWAVFRIRFINSLQYRAVVLGEIGMRVAWSVMEILAFIALYRAGGDFSMTLSQTVSYLWIKESLIVLFKVVFGDGEIYASIQNGGVAYELARPMDIYWRWFCQSAANRLAFTAVNCVPALALAMLLPAPYGLMPPAGAGAFMLFLLSLMLALCVVVAFAMLMYISMFYTLSHRGLKIIVTAVTTFLSGGVIPLPFFPQTLRTVIRFLPFAGMQNTPLQIYTGGVLGMTAVGEVLLQLFWLAALVLLGRAFMRRALGRVVAQGG